VGRKNVVRSYKMLDAVSLSTDQASAATNVLNLDYASIQVIWSGGGSPVGTITIQGTNIDPDLPTFSSTTDWSTLELSGTVSVSGNSGNHSIIFEQLPFHSIRFVYTRSTGTATLSAHLSSKTVGA
jgi:hypothetical protein